jgi:predicted metal-binding membrane protein
MITFIFLVNARIGSIILWSLLPFIVLVTVLSHMTEAVTIVAERLAEMAALIGGVVLLFAALTGYFTIGVPGAVVIPIDISVSISGPGDCSV